MSAGDFGRAYALPMVEKDAFSLLAPQLVVSQSAKPLSWSCT
jgi:hypothetical protein